MFVKVENGKVVKYPYSYDMLIADNPNTSFPYPVDLDSPFISERYGMFPVTFTAKPQYSYNQTCYEGIPILIDGKWTQNWIIRDLTAEELSSDTENEWNAVRSKRNKLLTNCDWTQLPDSTADKTAWSIYRQELRDLPNSTSNPFTIVWPIPPQ